MQQIKAQFHIVLTSRKFINIYIRKGIRNNWITEFDNYIFRYTVFGKNPKRQKAYVSFKDTGKPVPTKYILDALKTMR